MDKYLTAFQYFIKYDKEYVEDLDTRYHSQIVQVVQFLEETRPHIFIYHSPSMEEFIDFMDGNGFHIDTTSDVAKKWQRINPSIVTLVPEYTRECEFCTITVKINLKDENEEKFDTYYSIYQPYDEWEPTQNPLGSRVQNTQIILEVGTADARPPP